MGLVLGNGLLTTSAQVPAHDVLQGLQARHTHRQTHTHTHTCTYTHTHTHRHTGGHIRTHAHLATITTQDHDLHNFMIAQSIYSIMLHELSILVLATSQRRRKYCTGVEAIVQLEQGKVMCSGSVGTVATHGVTTSSPCASACVWA